MLSSFSLRRRIQKLSHPSEEVVIASETLRQAHHKSWMTGELDFATILEMDRWCPRLAAL